MPIPSEPPGATNGWIQRKIWQFMDWCEETQAVPNTNDFDVSENPKGRYFSLKPSAVQSIVASNIFRLQLIDASTATVPKVRVRLGDMAGGVADAGMTDPGDSPPFIITLPSTNGWYYIYEDVELAYSDTDGTWSTTGRSISSGSSVPSDTVSGTLPSPVTGHAYIEIGTAEVVSSSGGHIVGSIPPQSVSGDQWVARTGDSTTATHTNGLI